LRDVGISVGKDRDKDCQANRRWIIGQHLEKERRKIAEEVEEKEQLTREEER
jgi:hypothetical protein